MIKKIFKEYEDIIKMPPEVFALVLKLMIDSEFYITSKINNLEVYEEDVDVTFTLGEYTFRMEAVASGVFSGAKENWFIPRDVIRYLVETIFDYVVDDDESSYDDILPFSEYSYNDTENNLKFEVDAHAFIDKYLLESDSVELPEDSIIRKFYNLEDEYQENMKNLEKVQL
jgi:hypothetical protein